MDQSKDLIKIATEIFLSRGYSGTTMDAVAKAAGVAKKTIYAVYGDKEALFTTVASNLLRGRRLKLETLDRPEVLSADLKHYAREMLEDTFDRVGFGIIKLLGQEGHRFPELVRILEKTNVDGMVKPLTAFFEQMRIAGSLKRANPSEAAMLFIYLLYGDMSRRLLLQQEPPSKREIARHADRIVDLFFGGIDGDASGDFLQG